MEANAPPQPLPAGHGHGAAEDSRGDRGGRPDRVQRRAGLPIRLFPARVLLADPGGVPGLHAETVAAKVGGRC